MAQPSTTTDKWRARVAAWRASGERAEEFSRRDGYAASTLRWWASKLKHEPPAPPAIQLARVIRTVTAAPAMIDSPATIVIEASAACTRIAVSAGADRTTLAMVIEVLGVGAAR